MNRYRFGRGVFGPRFHATVCGAGLAALLLAAPTAGATPPDYIQGDWVFVVGSEYDYSAGTFSLMDMNPPWPHDNNYGTLHGDAVARSYAGLIYVVERWGADDIRVIDPQLDFETVLQFSVEPGSNPQDICFVSPTRAFVTRYDDTDLWEVDPSTGQHTDSIDLSPLADADGLPEMHGMAIHGGRLFVTVQRLDRDGSWQPVPPSYLAVIDLADNTLLDMDPGTPGTQGVALAGTCPSSGIVVDPVRGDFLIGQTGTYGAQDAGVERLDPQTLQSRGWVVTEATLGGNLNVWDTGDGVTGFAVVLTPEWMTRVVAFSLLTGQNLGTVASASEYAYTHLFVDPPRQQLFVCDRTYANPGIRIYRTTDHAPLTPNPISIGLYPFWLVGMHGPDTAVEDDPALTAAPRLELFPRPSTGRLSVSFSLAGAGEVDLGVFDAAGRRVATLAQGWRGPGKQRLTWDGAAGDGRALPSGTYFARLRTPAGTRWERLPIVR
jgi:hypothetical protein